MIQYYGRHRHSCTVSFCLVAQFPTNRDFPAPKRRNCNVSSAKSVSSEWSCDLLSGLRLFPNMGWRACSRVGSSSFKRRYPFCSLSNSWRHFFVTKMTYAADTQHGLRISQLIPTPLLTVKRCAYATIGNKLASTRIIWNLYLQCFQNYSKIECKCWDFAGPRIQRTFPQRRLYQHAAYTASVEPVLLLWRLLKITREIIVITIDRYIH